MAIVWFDIYEVGIKEIDDQHKHFVEKLNELYLSIGEKDPKKYKIILHDVVSYALEHFATEEKYFDQFKYEGASEHKAEHAKLLRDLSKFTKDEDIKLGFDFLDYLESWLHEHLAQQDQKYVQHFRKHGLK